MSGHQNGNNYVMLSPVFCHLVYCILSPCVCSMLPCPYNISCIILSDFDYEVFDDAYKSLLSCVIVDDIDQLLGEHHIPAPKY